MSSRRVATLVGVCALVVVWLAAAAGTRPGQPAIQVAPRVAVSETDTMADDIQNQAERLRGRLDSAPKPHQSARNPFEFATRGAMPTAGHGADGDPVTSEAVPSVQRPPLTLIGVAEYRLPDGVRRTAVISGFGQLFFANEGETVTPRFRVTAVGADSIDVIDLSENSTSTFRLGLAQGPPMPGGPVPR